MKKTMRKLRRVVWSLLLSAIMVIEPVVGSAVVYAAEITEEQAALTVEDEFEEPGSGQEDFIENEDENGENDSNETDFEMKEEQDGNIDDGSKEDGQEGSDESGDDQSGSDEDVTDETGDEEAGESGEDVNASEENEDSDAEDVEEETDEAEDVENDSLLSLDREELEALKEKMDTWAEENGRVPNGYRDVDYEVESLSEPVGISDDSFAAANRASVPSKYDARDKGQVAAIRNQQAWGSCWSFSAVASAESAYKMQNNGSEANLSETQLVHFFYNGNSNLNLAGPDGGLTGDKTTALTEVPVQQGGNSLFTTFALASWTGVVNEAKNPAVLEYPSYAYTEANPNAKLSIDSQYAYADEMHLENAYWIPLSDRSSIKKAIMEYGIVGVSYYYDAELDSDILKEIGYSGPAVYYNPYVHGTNHAVAIVGWDDNFDKKNFRNTYDNFLYIYEDGEDPILPQKNGAWLIRNSWGTDYGDAGYFWIPYEDASFTYYNQYYQLVDYSAFAFDFSSADNYDHNYQYDGSNGTDNLGSSAGTVTAAAVYTATGEQKISAVGVGFASTSTNYTIKIYTGLTDESNPESGTLATTVTGKTSFEGFYTINIKDWVIVDKGEKFGIVVTANKSGGAYLFTDSSYTNGDWISFTANTANDKTFLKNGTTWVNAGTNMASVSSSLSNCTFRIKAYTHDVDSTVQDGDRVLTADMLEEIPPQEFNGTAVDPDFNIVFDGAKLTKGTDYTVTYLNNSNEKAGTATAEIKGIGKYKGEFTTTFTITKKAITDTMISDISGWTYDAADHAVDLKVYNGTHLMTENTDYTVKYSKSPLNAAGTYTVTVTGKDNYSGSAKKTFTIEKLPLTENMVSLSSYTEVYTGKALTPAVTVKIGETEIPAANYTVKYANNKVRGTATVTVTGKGNCQGSVTKDFAIIPATITADAVTLKSETITYTGSEVKPAVTVKVSGTTLKLNQDYELSYNNNINVTAEDSQATVIVIGKGNYSGEVVKTFKIDKQTVAANRIKVAALTPFGCDVTVNGKVISTDNYALNIMGAGETNPAVELKPGSKYDVTITLKKNYQNANDVPAIIKNVVCKISVASLNLSIVDPVDAEKLYPSGAYSCEYKGSAYKPAIKVTDGDTPLTTKAYSVSYANNTNAGTATITITGKGDYSGTKSINFTINRKPTANLGVTFASATYTGKELTPAVTVKADNKKLKAGTDYTITGYTNNVNASTNAVVHITLNNYEVSNGEQGYTTIVTKEFDIKPAKISSVKVGESYYKGKEAIITPTLTVKAGKIENLVKDTDYTAVFEGHNQGLTNKASVTVEGKGNFEGTKKVTFKITKEPLSKVTVDGIVDKVYAGVDGVTQSSVSLKDSSGALIPSSEYTIEYKNNIKAGTASVIIKATAEGNYSGSVTKKFKITKAKLEDRLSVTGSLPAKTYDGSKHTYTVEDINAAVTAKVSGEQPTYKVSYLNNVNAGTNTATVVLTGSGNYEGQVKVNFTINRQDINKVNVTLQSTTMKYSNGNQVLAKIKQAVYGKLKLTAKKDYTLSYANTTKKGLATVKVTGTGNYYGTKNVYYYIQ